VRERPSHQPIRVPPEAIAQTIELYRQGYFPMAREGVITTTRTRAIEWVQPRMRGLIPLDDRFHVPKSLARALRQTSLVFTTDQAFPQVIRECAQPAEGRETTWLEPRIIALFDALFGAGLAHSVEAWRVDGSSRVLVGGTYGLALGTAWCGESMFSRPALGGTNASKMCLVHLVRHLQTRGFSLFDAQLSNPHLLQFGLYEMPAENYLAQLRSAAAQPCPAWQPWIAPQFIPS